MFLGFSNFLKYHVFCKASEKTQEKYNECLGLRFNEFMSLMGIIDQNSMSLIKQLKHKFYPDYFNLFIPNKILIELIRSFHLSGGMTALASTASRGNIVEALKYIGATDIFDLIYCGEDVTKAKPHPEIYNKIISYYGVTPSETIVFEDSAIGVSAARAAGVNYIIIDKNFYGN